MSLFFYKVIQKWFQVGSMCLFFVLYVLNVLSLLFGRPKMAYNDLKICELADLELQPVDLQQR
jgi:hypothetical protein